MPNRVGGLVVVANEILVSAQGPLVLCFGLKGLGPGLDNCREVSERLNMSQGKVGEGWLWLNYKMMTSRKEDIIILN